ncbi:hypothetical protein BDFB_014873 [Asbolus verrucosus]|uniref:Uncharacterized protein n=1 Tax=Asbolus verrucosus TaxID=1661398 RepID=A0A482VZ53_ASBVE|nr:hypothetical protein BDFB_014873 [Asbolus verrucosus]
MVNFFFNTKLKRAPFKYLELINSLKLSVSSLRIWDCPTRKATQAIASEDHQLHQLLYWSV